MHRGACRVTALVMAALVALALAAIPAGVTAPLWWPACRVWLPSLYRSAVHVVASAELVARAEDAQDAAAARQREAGRQRRSYAAHAARPAAVARARRARVRRGWAA